ncbi:MAG: tetratricopeptide repeat protein [bacterium]|nr:tetratricopeptide repeat protein [bacterium]
MINNFNAGKVSAAFAYIIFLLWGIHKCHTISKRETTCTKCVNGLMFVLIGLLVIGFTKVITTILQATVQPLLILVFIIANVLALIGCGLAIQGLQQYKDNPHYQQGRGQAIWALIISFFILGSTMVGLSKRFNGEVELPKDYRITNTANTVKEFKDLNFKYKIPAEPWVEVKAAKLNPNATFGLMDTRNHILFFVIAEKAGADIEMDSKTLVTFCRSLMKSASKEITFTEPLPYEVNGVNGLRFSSDAVTMGKTMAYTYWVSAHNGYNYQLIAFCERKRKKNLKESADFLFSRFSLLDSKKVVYSEYGTPFGTFTSPVFNYTINLNGTPWLRQNDTYWLEAVPNVEVAGFMEDETSFTVTPFFYGNEPPESQLLAQLLASTLKINLLNPVPIRLKWATEAGMRSCRIQVEKQIDGSSYTFHVKIFKGKECGYMFALWGLRNAPETAGKAETFFDAISFSKGTPVTPGKMDASVKASQADIHNELGVVYFDEKQYKKAIKSFKKAAVLNPDIPVYFENFSHACFELSNYKEGLEFLDKYKSHWQKTPAVVTLYMAFKVGMQE